MVVGPRAFHVTTGDSFEVWTYGTDGDLLQIVRVAHEAIPVAESDVAARRSPGLPDVPHPPTFPAHGSTLLDEEGQLWVEEFRKDEGAASRWIILSPDGAIIASLSLIPRFTPMHAGRDYVLGIWKDEMDVEHVRLHRLERGDAPDGDG